MSSGIIELAEPIGIAESLALRDQYSQPELRHHPVLIKIMNGEGPYRCIDVGIENDGTVTVSPEELKPVIANGKITGFQKEEK